MPLHTIFVAGAALAMSLLPSALATNSTAGLKICGHGSSDCSPVTSAELGVTICAFVLTPFFLFVGTFAYFLWEDEISSFRARRQRGTGTTQPAATAAAVTTGAQDEEAGIYEIELPGRNEAPLEVAASSAAVAGEDEGGSAESWECSACTYVNEPSARKCQMCDVAKQ